MIEYRAYAGAKRVLDNAKKPEQRKALRGSSALMDLVEEITFDLVKAEQDRKKQARKT